MKNLFLSLIALVGCLLLNPANVMALHHEPPNSQGSAGKLATNEGTVISFVDTTGYTYMELENDGNKFWIAAIL